MIWKKWEMHLEILARTTPNNQYYKGLFLKKIINSPLYKKCFSQEISGTKKYRKRLNLGVRHV